MESDNINDNIKAASMTRGKVVTYKTITLKCVSFTWVE